MGRGKDQRHIPGRGGHGDSPVPSPPPGCRRRDQPAGAGDGLWQGNRQRPGRVRRDGVLRRPLRCPRPGKAVFVPHRRRLCQGRRGNYLPSPSVPEGADTRGGIQGRAYHRRFPHQKNHRSVGGPENRTGGGIRHL